MKRRDPAQEHIPEEHLKVLLEIATQLRAALDALNVELSPEINEQPVYIQIPVYAGTLRAIADGYIGHMGAQGWELAQRARMKAAATLALEIGK